jgi:hypothetical protein
MFEAGVPPASVLRGETIGDERVFDNNNFAGTENESPFSINQFLNPLIFIRVVKVLEVMTFSNRGHFDHCTLCWDMPARKYAASITIALATLIVLDVLPLTHISVQGVGSLMSFRGYMSLYLLGEELALLGAMGCWTVASRSKLISGIGICRTYCGIFLMKLKNYCANVSSALCSISCVLHFLYR